MENQDKNFDFYKAPSAEERRRMAARQFHQMRSPPPTTLDKEVRPALILDLDGTVRRCRSGKPFIESLDDIELMPGIEPILWDYRKYGWIVAAVSNQAGVAHGYKTELDLEDEIMTMLSLFTPTAVKNRRGVVLTPHPFLHIGFSINDAAGNTEPFNHRSLMRKPAYGMLAQVEWTMWQMNYVVDWDNSLFVGDRDEDMVCAHAAEIRYLDINDFLSQPTNMSRP